MCDETLGAACVQLSPDSDVDVFFLSDLVKIRGGTNYAKSGNHPGVGPGKAERTKPKRLEPEMETSRWPSALYRIAIVNTNEAGALSVQTVLITIPGRNKRYFNQKISQCLRRRDLSYREGSWYGAAVIWLGTARRENV